jgi:hypothetical protein
MYVCMYVCMYMRPAMKARLPIKIKIAGRAYLKNKNSGPGPAKSHQAWSAASLVRTAEMGERGRPRRFTYR